MATVEQFTINFDASGDKKLLGKLNALSLAMQKFGNNEKKVQAQSTALNSSTLKLTAQLAAQGKVWKDIGVRTSTVSKAMRGNQIAVEKLRNAYKKQNTVNRVLGGSFAVLRSKMLLFSFAMSMGIRQVMEFTKEAAKVQSMERGFNALSGATGSSTIALERLKEATNGTMSEFDLFQQANNAMILGVSNNSKEMAEMFDIAQRLGSALGRDTKTSVESLITGIGRQSRMMLDNIGIITKVDKANEEYASSLNKNVSQLTESEKKQAFFNATMEAARQKVAGLAEEVITAQHQIDAFDAAMSDLKSNIGEGMQFAFLPLINAMTRLSKLMTPERVEAYAQVFGTILVVAIGKYIMSLKKAVAWQTKLGWGALIVGAGLLAEAVMRLNGVFDDNADSLDISAQKTDAMTKALMKLSLVELIHQQAVLNAVVTDSFNPYENIIKLIEKYIGIVGKGFSSMDDFIDKQDKVNALWLKTPEGQRQVIENQKDMVESLLKLDPANQKYLDVLKMLEEQLVKMDSPMANMIEHFDMISKKMIEFAEGEIESEREYAESRIAIIDEVEKKELAALRNTWLYKKQTDRQKAASEKEITDKHLKQREKLRKEANKDIQRAFKATQTLKASQAIMNTAEQITLNLGKPWKIAFIAAMGAIQLATIKAEKPPKMQYGGMVGGKRHSQGGTMIEAEQGEFVLSRAAVEATGIEALNRINAGTGGAGGTSIIINNPILGKDTIEDEIVPQIKEALRRGGDIGV